MSVVRHPRRRKLELIFLVAALAISPATGRAANQPPELAPISTQTVDEETTLTLTAVATDADLPAQRLTFQFGAGRFTGATLDTNTGAFSWTPTEGQGPGSTHFSIVVTDDGSPSLTATQHFNVLVQEVNRAPTLVPVPDQNVGEGDLLVVSVVSEDRDLPLQNLTFALADDAPTGASISTGGFSGGLFLWTPDETQGPGSYVITVTVTDDGVPSLSATQRFNVVVTEHNLAPAIPVIPEQSIDEGELLSFTIAANDPDLPAQHLTFTLGGNAPAGAAIDPVSGLFTWTPNETQGPGTYFISVTVTDDGSPRLDAAQLFSVTVRELNQRPTLATIPDQSISEGDFLSFIVSATDPDLPAQGLTFSLGADTPAGASITAGGFFNWTPDEAQGPGAYRISVRVSDDGSPSLTATQRFNVVVAERNRAPVIPVIPEQTVNESELLSFTIAANDPDLPAQHLTFSLGGNAPAGAAIDPVSGLFTWTPTEAQGPGTHFISVIVTDDGTPSLNVVQSLVVTVREVNQQPTLATIPDQSISEGDFLVFIVSATDPDLPAQRLAFSLDADAPAGASISPAGVFTWTPDEAQGPAAYRISVIVSDDGSPSLTATQRFNVVVAERNRAPEIAAIAEQRVNEGELLSFLIPASDPDLPAQALTFSLGAGAPPGASVDSATGLFRWTPTEAQGPGTNTVSVLVTDDGTPSLSTARSFSIVIREVNSPPSITPVTNQTVRTGELLVFTVPASDPDIPTQHLTFTLGAGAPAGASISPEGLFTWTPRAAQGPAVYFVNVLVRDDGSPPLRATNEVRITVTGNLPTPPRLENPAFSGTTLSASVATVTGRTYFLERTLSLSPTDWKVVGQQPGTGGIVTLIDLTATNSQSFYRARVE